MVSSALLAFQQTGCSSSGFWCPRDFKCMQGTQWVCFGLLLLKELIETRSWCSRTHFFRGSRAGGFERTFSTATNRLQLLWFLCPRDFKCMQGAQWVCFGLLLLKELIETRSWCRTQHIFRGSRAGGFERTFSISTNRLQLLWFLVPT